MKPKNRCHGCGKTEGVFVKDECGRWLCLKCFTEASKPQSTCEYCHQPLGASDPETMHEHCMRELDEQKCESYCTQCSAPCHPDDELCDGCQGEEVPVCEMCKVKGKLHDSTDSLRINGVTYNLCRDCFNHQREAQRQRVEAKRAKNQRGKACNSADGPALPCAACGASMLKRDSSVGGALVCEQCFAVACSLPNHLSGEDLIEVLRWTVSFSWMWDARKCSLSPIDSERYTTRMLYKREENRRKRSSQEGK